MGQNMAEYGKYENMAFMVYVKVVLSFLGFEGCFWARIVWEHS